MFDTIAILLVLSALIAYVNRRFVGLPTAIGVTSIALGTSIVLVLMDRMGLGQLKDYEASLLSTVDFPAVLLQGMLSLLLFAGALRTDLAALRALRWPVGILALLGTAASAVLVGAALWACLPLLGIRLPLLHCLLFGALISPTDPVAVLEVLKSAGLPQRLCLLIKGESLFNDGVGIALFSLLLHTAQSGHFPGIAVAALTLLREAGGGLLAGAVLGYVTTALLARLDSYEEQVLVTLAAVVGGYALALRLQVSGPIAMVVAGLLVGSRTPGPSRKGADGPGLHAFWNLLDTVLNALLFMLIGLEVIRVHTSWPLLGAALLAIALLLGVRLLLVVFLLTGARRLFQIGTGSWAILTWAGVRGGISVALVLSLLAGPERNLLLGMTYGVVIFSILVQGLSIGRLVRQGQRHESA